jgi:hypothetical protein
MGTSHTSPGKLNHRGLDLEKTSRLRSSRTFFLTSLLIELIDAQKDEEKAHTCNRPDFANQQQLGRGSDSYQFCWVALCLLSAESLQPNYPLHLMAHLGAGLPCCSRA